MHAVHHTEAFILKIRPAGEANARAWLFTRELGLVVAAVQGVRKQGAKLAMQLSEYSLVAVDLVRGKEVWRLVSVSEINNPFISATRTSSRRDRRLNELGRGYVRTLAAVERFCHGEEAHPELFEHLLGCIEALKDKDLDTRSFDTVSLWKVMAALGYVAVEDRDRELFAMPFAAAVERMDGPVRTRLIKETNEIIKQTHL